VLLRKNLKEEAGEGVTWYWKDFTETQEKAAEVSETNILTEGKGTWRAMSPNLFCVNGKLFTQGHLQI